MANQSQIPNETKDLLYKNLGVKKFILEFFKTRHGKKCRVRDIIGWDPFYYLDKYDAIRLYSNQDDVVNYRKRANLTDINIHNIDSNLYYGDINFHLEYIFSNEIETDRIIYGEEHTSLIADHIIGLTPVFDIDSPGIIKEDGTEDRKNRVDFFSVVPYFNDYIAVVCKELTNRGIDYRQVFSGNGVHIVGQAYYPEEHGHDREKVFEFNDKFVTLIKNINHRLKVQNNNVNINTDLNVYTYLSADKRSKSWNRFYKIPFSFHASRNRISIPLNKGTIDAEWLKRVTSLDNIRKDSSIIDEILKCTENEWSKNIW